MKRFFALLLAAGLGVGVLGSCSSSTDPGDGGPVRVIYDPDRQFMDIVIPDSFDFTVSASGPASLAATWKLNGVEVGEGSSYHYQSGAVGVDTLTVVTVLDGKEGSRDWLITVLPSVSLLPPPVPDVGIQDGEAPMDVVVSWHWINHSAFPIVDYLVAGSYEGPITTENWDEAMFLGTFPQVPGQAGYTALFTAEEDGMLPDTVIWIAVRGRDDHGQLSPIAEISQHTISFAWWIEGTVYDTEMTALPEIIIDYGCGSCRVNTDVNGFYRVGPFKNVDSVDIYTLSRNVDQEGVPFTSWYDFQADTFVYDEEGNTHDLMLITRYGTDDQCLTYDHEFLLFLRRMTLTDMTTYLRPNFRLFKWEEYPIPVYIPDYVRPEDGMDFGYDSRLAVGYWNLVMDEDYLVLVDDPALARIEFVFTDLGAGANGRASLAAPQDPYYYGLGDVIPEKILVEINNVVLPTDQRIQETSMHELGHAMGLYSHVESCSDRPYLMNVTSAHALDNGPENAVHIDEQRMIRAIRYLPQGIDMSSFRLD